MVDDYTYSYNTQQLYLPRSRTDTAKGFILASLASGGLLKASEVFLNPFRNQILKEAVHNDLYRDAFYKVMNKPELMNKGCSVSEAQFDIISSDISRGQNACYIPNDKIIRLNTEKAAATGFHEAGHAANHLLSKSARLLQKMRTPGMYIAGLMELCAFFSRTKPKDAPKNIGDKIEDNCGKIAFAAMTPIVAEEALASYKGIEMAKSVGLPKHLVNNLKKLYSKALMTYASRAVFGGFAVALTRMIMDKYTYPEKIENGVPYI